MSVLFFGIMANSKQLRRKWILVFSLMVPLGGPVLCDIQLLFNSRNGNEFESSNKVSRFTEAPIIIHNIRKMDLHQ